MRWDIEKIGGVVMWLQNAPVPTLISLSLWFRVLEVEPDGGPSAAAAWDAGSALACHVLCLAYFKSGGIISPAAWARDGA